MIHTFKIYASNWTYSFKNAEIHVFYFNNKLESHLIQFTPRRIMWRLPDERSGFFQFYKCRINKRYL